MKPTTPEQGFAQAIADRDNIIRGLLSEAEALTKERDALAANHKDCVKCLGEALQDRANLAAAAKLALDALDEAQKYAYNVGKYLHGVPQAITALRQAVVQ